MMQHAICKVTGRRWKHLCKYKYSKQCTWVTFHHCLASGTGGVSVSSAAKQMIFVLIKKSVDDCLFWLAFFIATRATAFWFRAAQFSHNSRRALSVFSLLGTLRWGLRNLTAHRGSSIFDELWHMTLIVFVTFGTTVSISNVCPCTQM